MMFGVLGEFSLLVNFIPFFLVNFRQLTLTEDDFLVWNECFIF